MTEAEQRAHDAFLYGLALVREFCAHMAEKFPASKVDYLVTKDYIDGQAGMMSPGYLPLVMRTDEAAAAIERLRSAM